MMNWLLPAFGGETTNGQNLGVLRKFEAAGYTILIVITRKGGVTAQNIERFLVA